MAVTERELEPHVPHLATLRWLRAQQDGSSATYIASCLVWACREQYTVTVWMERATDGSLIGRMAWQTDRSAT